MVGKTDRQKNAENRVRTKERGPQARFFFFLLLVRFFSLVYTDRKPGTGYIERLVVEIK